MNLLPDSANYDLVCRLQACQPRSRRNGKVARLPAELRAQINRMMDDGVAYKDIITSLGPAGEHLNEHNLSNWRLGGYQDFLKAQPLNDRAQLQAETAAQIVAKGGDLNEPRLKTACKRVALAQYLSTLVEHGEHLAREAVLQNPAKMITLMNVCSRR